MIGQKCLYDVCIYTYLKWVEVCVLFAKDVGRHYLNDSNLHHSKLPLGPLLCVCVCVCVCVNSMRWKEAKVLTMCVTNTPALSKYMHCMHHTISPDLLGQRNIIPSTCIRSTIFNVCVCVCQLAVCNSAMHCLNGLLFKQCMALDVAAVQLTHKSSNT